MKPIIDISYWQQNIDYDKFAKNISGAILRGAYGIWKDTMFDKHYKELHDRGVPIGAYHYIIGNYTGLAQADIFNQVVAGKELKLGLWNDVEDRRVTTGLFPGVVIDYHNNIEVLAKRKVGIYTGVYAWYEIMGDKSKMFADRPLWVAHYGVIAPALPRYGGWTKWLLWQMSDSGTVDGYLSHVDVDLFNGSEEQYRKYFNLDEIIPPTTPEPPTTSTIELKVLQNMNIRSDPTISASVVGTRAVGDIVKVQDIHATSSTSVWVKDERGWSAIVHGLLKYME
jgi:GH25 family lysozyme M1 (1,4-beta-N-acetylmuramidase)